MTVRSASRSAVGTVRGRIVGLMIGTAVLAPMAMFTGAAAASASTTARLQTSVAIASVNGHIADPSTQVSPGATIAYVVTVSNSGRASGRTTVADPVPANAQFSGSGWSCAPGAPAGTPCRRAITVAAGATVRTPYRVRLTDYPGATTTIAEALQTSSGSCVVCSVSSPTVAHLVTTNVLFRVNGVTVGGSAGMSPGNYVGYHVTVRNSGGSSGRTTVTETVSNHTEYVGKNQGWSCPTHSPQGSSCTQTVTVGPGQSAVLHYTVSISLYAVS